MKRGPRPCEIPVVSPTNVNASVARLFDMSGRLAVRVPLVFERHHAERVLTESPVFDV